MSRKKKITKKPNKAAGTFERYWRPKYFWSQFKGWWNAKLWHRIVLIITLVVFIATVVMFGMAQWYIQRHKNEPLKIGATFISEYAEYFGLDARETLEATLDDLGIRRLRLVSYWKSIEKTEGEYDFSYLDWQFDMAEKYDAEVSLAIGLRQPRWPECHMPDWAHSREFSDVQPQLYDYIAAVVDRYKDRPSLQSYQLENEFFLEVFGECPDFSKQRLTEELALVKLIDPDTPVVISRSNNAVPSWPVREPLPDIVGASIYKRVWDKTITKRYFEYPLPSWFYSFLAAGSELSNGKKLIIHELQIEPWLPDNVDLATAPIEEQDKTMSAEDIDNRLQYGINTGIRSMDLWGVEWWYHRKVNINDPSVWDAGKKAISDAYKND